MPVHWLTRYENLNDWFADIYIEWFLRPWYWMTWHSLVLLCMINLVTKQALTSHWSVYTWHWVWNILWNQFHLTIQMTFHWFLSSCSSSLFNCWVVFHHSSPLTLFLSCFPIVSYALSCITSEVGRRLTGILIECEFQTDPVCTQLFSPSQDDSLG